MVLLAVPQAPTLQASIQPLESRIATMEPVTDIVFPSPTGNGNREERDLFHAMSNTGAVSLAAALAAYQKRHEPNRKVPYTLLVCDSTPGRLDRLDFTTQRSRWSGAMAVGTWKYFPWPFAITQALWYSLLGANRAWEWVRGTEPSGVWANQVINDLAISPIESNRLCLYSKKDEIIWWEDLVQAVAQIKGLGYKVDLEIFKGSPHVGHMRLHPQQYWNKILSASKETKPRC